MNPELSPSSSQPQKLEVRSWYLIGLVCLVTALLVLGEYFSFNLPVSSEIHSNVDQQNTETVSVRSQVLSSHSSGESASVEEL